jgi:hypothetical protein
MIQAAPIRAYLVGSDQCRAEGRTVRAAAPVLETCRRLVRWLILTDRCIRYAAVALSVSSIYRGAASRPGEWCRL